MNAMSIIQAILAGLQVAEQAIPVVASYERLFGAGASLPMQATINDQLQQNAAHPVTQTIVSQAMVHAAAAAAPAAPQNPAAPAVAPTA